MDHDESQEQQHSPSDEQSPNPAGDNDFEIVTVTWNGKSWNVPKDRGRWDMNVQFELEEGNNMRAILILLGGAENLYKTRAELHEVCKTQADFAQFKEHVGEVLNKECIG
jgi:hypothetical protein